MNAWYIFCITAACLLALAHSTPADGDVMEGPREESSDGYLPEINEMDYENLEISSTPHLPNRREHGILKAPPKPTPTVPWWGYLLIAIFLVLVFIGVGMIVCKKCAKRHDN
ncbi:unnamed protein product [Hymenolepis diminuta]|uniref:Uncharacterized protein n=1 Tax=Hymenolepis diminuta TaxID=6216 RepID=A0A564YQ76_HYMDI|nr:unnamed protein product [Hymenolepis diminuta]